MMSRSVAGAGERAASPSDAATGALGAAGGGAGFEGATFEAALAVGAAAAGAAVATVAAGELAGVTAVAASGPLTASASGFSFARLPRLVI